MGNLAKTGRLIRGGRGLLGLMTAGLMMLLISSPAHAQSKINVFGGYSYGTNNVGYGCECDPGLHGYAASFTYNLAPHLGLEGTFSGHSGTTTVDSAAPSSEDTGFQDSVKQSIYTYTFGPRLSLPLGNFSVYTHFLVGATHMTENTSQVCLESTDESGCYEPYYDNLKGNGFTFKTGGGVDWNHGAWGLRVLEVDYLHSDIPFSGTETESPSPAVAASFDSGVNSFEMAAGVTFNFGSSSK
jgi:Outer membrane protein beta-barrel domain